MATAMKFQAFTLDHRGRFGGGGDLPFMNSLTPMLSSKLRYQLLLMRWGECPFENSVLVFRNSCTSPPSFVKFKFYPTLDNFLNEIQNPYLYKFISVSVVGVQIGPIELAHEFCFPRADTCIGTGVCLPTYVISSGSVSISIISAWDTAGHPMRYYISLSLTTLTPPPTHRSFKPIL